MTVLYIIAMKSPRNENLLPFRKKVLYYGLMLVLTLLVLEGMARLAYYAAYGTGYGGGGSDAAVNLTSLHFAPRAAGEQRGISHPFYGFSHNRASSELNAMPLPQRQEDTVVIGLLGGSVAQDVQPFLQFALNRWFAANRPPRRSVVLSLAIGGAKQPQQTMILVNNLLMGGEFDLIVNLDGFNEMIFSGENFGEGVSPFFPRAWHNRVGLTRADILRAGQIGVLRREQARLAAAGETSLLRRSALFGLAHRWRQESNAAQIIQRNHALAAVEPAYSLERHGPRRWLPAEDAVFAATARLWYRGSVALARLAALAGAEYYHFLQPNQYVPGSKPLSPGERESAYAPHGFYKSVVERGYPLLRESHRDLPGQGVNYFDLTAIFADHPETLYRDKCCHLNYRGNELLAAAMAQRLEPALRRLGGASPAGPGSALAAGRRPEKIAPPAAPDFQVSLAAAGKELRYVRADCAPEKLEPVFFLHLIPRDLTDLPLHRQLSGFDNQNFNFAEVGGRFSAGQCAAQIPLPPYPIAALRTGQYIPGLRDLWSVELIVPANPDQLRADYAALASAEPVVRDYFALYVQDNQLLYLRESCAAANTAAAFFLHIVPEDVADLPADRQAAGFAHRDFAFARHGGHFDGKCLAAFALPDYPLKEIRTGQHIPDQGNLWSVELITAPDSVQLRGDYAALSAMQPAARDYFALYRREGRLFYLRESCAAADTAADFFLHIIPEDITDLPEHRRDAGFAHGGFAFVRQGGHFDGKCLAAVSLPDYPGGIKEMRTGQFVPGQGDLWSATIATP